MFQVNSESKCPHCGHVLDGATPATNDPNKPRPGDISICIECYAPLKFRKDMTLRYLTKEEWQRMSVSDVVQLRQVITRLKQLKGAQQ